MRNLVNEITDFYTQKIRDFWVLLSCNVQKKTALRNAERFGIINPWSK